MRRPGARTFGRGRRLGILLNVLVMMGLAVAAAAIGIWLTGFTDLRRRFDLTQAETYTLRLDTTRLLEGLEEDVEIITIFDRLTWHWDVDQVRPKAMEYVVDLLQEYRVRARGRISVENLDPRIDFDRVRDLFTEHGLSQANVVIVRSGKSRRFLGLETDLAEFDFGAASPVFQPTRLLAYTAEEALSSALFEVTQAAQPVVHVISGHGELSLSDASEMGGSYIGSTLTRDNFDVRPLSLIAERKVPEDAGALLLLGPQTAFLDEEIVALDAYLRGGGKMLVAVDPLGDRSLDPLFERLGLRLERNIMCYDQKGVLRGASVTEMWVGPARLGTPGTYGSHEITNTLAEDGVVFVVIRSAAVSPADEAIPWFTSLLSSHPDTFGDIPDGQTKAGNYQQDPRLENAGQRCLGAAFEPGGAYAGARLVFVPSVAWVTNRALYNFPGNDTFLRRSAAWLIGRKRSIQLPPRRPRAIVADLKPGEEDEIFRYTAVYLPAGALVLAFLVWLARRR
ncbi:MAG: GldG family protein [Planctomycetes bacterium]|nr:GldG family protein [Planctomycetota bacterium]